MATTQLQLRRGTAAEHSSFTGAQGEITFNTTNNKIHTHDGSTLGGNPIALASDLANLVTNSSLASTLTGYTSSSALTTALSSYVTSSSLASTLGSYVTGSSLTSTLNNYVTGTSLTGTLASYVTASDVSGYITSSSLTTTLASYATVSSLSSYATTSSLGSYITSTSLSSTLSSYVTSSSLTSTLSGYVTSSTNHDIPTGGATGQVLVKNSSTNYDAVWAYPKVASITTVSSGTYTFVLSDQYVRVTTAGASVLTVPANSSVAYPIGTQITIVWASGNTSCTIASAGGVTILYTDTLSMRKTGSAATLTKVATDTWDLAGDMVVS